ncbi:MAG: ribonuclease P subunit P30 [Methanobrevibacter sp.]|nr:ribonuclease P subunit P30 [Methanobrevibacter sp.]
MMFYDLNIRGKDLQSDLKIINEANRLGYNHVNLVYDLNNFKDFDYKKDLISEVENISQFNKEKLSIDFAVEINPKNPNDIRKGTSKFKKKVKFISVFGGDVKINRMSCESRQVDILTRPYFKRYDCGMNHVLAKEAVENNVAIELCFTDILKSYSNYRSKILSNFRDLIKLYIKFKFPLIISSRAESIFDIRSPKDVISIFKSLGLNNEELDDIFHNYPKNIIDFGYDKKNIIVLGVKEIEK